MQRTVVTVSKVTNCPLHTAAHLQAALVFARRTARAHSQRSVGAPLLLLRNAQPAHHYPLPPFNTTQHKHNTNTTQTGGTPPEEAGASGGRRSKRARLVYRLLRDADVRPQLLGEEVHILWPDDGVWYLAVVQRVRARQGGRGGEAVRKRMMEGAVAEERRRRLGSGDGACCGWCFVHTNTVAVRLEEGRCPPPVSTRRAHHNVYMYTRTRILHDLGGACR